MKVLVTGVAGFIGFHVSKALLDRGNVVIGVDNVNDYYDDGLKERRLSQLQESTGFVFYKVDIADATALRKVAEKHSFDVLINLAAQAGVRYSLENPIAYVESNVVGFVNILELCRNNKVRHLVYASSSSVYGSNEAMPFSERNNVDHPVSLYAATKKTNELMAHTYSHLYGLPTTGLRFFTVYGPWGRPDMSPIIFAKAIMKGQPIKVFNYGRHRRDFTYIDDIVNGVLLALDKVPQGNSQWSGLHPDPSSSRAPWRVYNIGNSAPVQLIDYIEIMEQALGKKTEKILLPLQLGDVEHTYADITALQKDTGYSPSVSIEAGLESFAEWFKGYYKY